MVSQFTVYRSAFRGMKIRNLGGALTDSFFFLENGAVAKCIDTAGFGPGLVPLLGSTRRNTICQIRAFPPKSFLLGR